MNSDKTNMHTQHEMEETKYRVEGHKGKLITGIFDENGLFQQIFIVYSYIVLSQVKEGLSPLNDSKKNAFCKCNSRAICL